MVLPESDKVALCDRHVHRAKGAIRDVVKAHGLPEDVIKALSSDMCQMAEVGKGVTFLTIEDETGPANVVATRI